MTITGRYLGVPVSIVSIGMGHPNMDFFVRETRECLRGDMVVIRYVVPKRRASVIDPRADRLGSCGGLIGLPVGSLVVPKASVAVSRNTDYDFTSDMLSDEIPYRISKPASSVAISRFDLP